MSQYDYDEEDQELPEDVGDEDFGDEDLGEDGLEEESSKSKRNVEQEDDDDLEDLVGRSSEDKFSLAKEDSTQETTTTIRNFRQSPDIEGLYRFVDEHGLRRDAHLIFDKIVTHLSKKKKKSKNS